MTQSNSSGFTGLVFQKEAQVQALWAVYTAVQFTLGGFGLSQYHDDVKMPLVLGISVLAGTWAFNLGHLGMILRCLKQNISLKNEMINGKLIADEDRESIVRIISTSPFPKSVDRFAGREYGTSIVVHLFIDICASVALMSRVAISGG